MPIFKNDSGQYYLNALFYEMVSDKTFCLYTLKEEDHKGYTSLKRCYLSCQDPTEYEFANKFLAGWEHWSRLQKCSWFQPHLTQWREEVVVREKAKALAVIQKQVEDGNLTAAKFVMEKGYSDSSDVGRPTKEKIKKEAKKLAADESDILSDFDRIQPSLEKPVFN